MLYTLHVLYLKQDVLRCHMTGALHTQNYNTCVEHVISAAILL